MATITEDCPFCTNGKIYEESKSSPGLVIAKNCPRCNNGKITVRIPDPPSKKD